MTERRIGIGVAFSVFLALFSFAFSAGYLQSRVASLEVAVSEARVKHEVESEWRATVLSKLSSLEAELHIYTEFWKNAHSKEK